MSEILTAKGGDPPLTPGQVKKSVDDLEENRQR